MTLGKKPFENIVGKGESGGIHVFPRFQKATDTGLLKVMIVWSLVKGGAVDKIILDRTEKLVGKGENIGNKQFLLFPEDFVLRLVQGFLKKQILGSSKLKDFAFDNFRFNSKLKWQKVLQKD